MSFYSNFRVCASIMAAMLCAVSAGAQGPIPAPTNARVEYTQNPLGIETKAPRFSWWMQHPEYNEMQTAYQILVATTAEVLSKDQGDLWDSGKTASSANVHVEYAGKPLTSFHRYFWKVKIWDAQDRPSAFSEPGWFEMALMEPVDFTAKWIRGDEEFPDSSGIQSNAVDKADAAQWFQVDLGEPRTLAGVTLYPANLFDEEPKTPGFGFPVRYKIEVSDAADFAAPTVVVDKTTEDQPNPGLEPVKLTFPAKPARYVRVTGTVLSANAKKKFILALAELEALDEQGKNVALKAPVTASTAIDKRGWHKDRLVDGRQKSEPSKHFAPPLMRKGFAVSKPVFQARAYVSGLGYYELYLNGQKVGDRVLDPGNQKFIKRALYSVYDVTSQIKQGDNVTGLMLGHGWHRETCAGWLQLRIEYVDGSVDTIVTDPSWKYAAGAIVEDSLYNGETYDARLEKPGWDKPGFDDSKWAAATVFDTPPPALSAQVMPPIREVKTIPVSSLSQREDGSVIVDFGQNFTGWIRLTATGKAGTEITIRHSELLHKDGSLNMENLRSAQATDKYTLKGGDTETYTPRFTQHGFRYAEIKGYPGKLIPDNLVGCVVHTDLQRAGEFKSSSTLFNRIDDLTNWSILSNCMSIPTDCPQRDERMGWMGDAHLAAEAAILNFDMVSFYESWLRVIADSQSTEGFVPDTAPNAAFGSQNGDPAWAVAYPLVTYYVYHYYGDRRAMEDHYPNLVRWFNTIEVTAKDNILEKNSYGDWVGVEETPKDLISTGVYYWTAKILNEFATALNKPEDVQRFAGKMKDIAAAFNAKYFDKDKGYYGNGSQYSQIWPVYLGISPDDLRAKAMEHLASEIVDKRKGHLATGILGTKYLYHALSDNGKVDLAYLVTKQEDYPGYGYMLKNGATTLWELWKLETGKGMNSHNHQMFGSVVDWFFGDVAGINTLPQPGYPQVTIAPQLDKTHELTSAEAYVDTVRGRVSSSWRMFDNGKGLDLKVSVPPNMKANVVVPMKAGAEITVTPKLPDTAAVAGKLGAYTVGSGEYNFSVRTPAKAPAAH